MRLPKIITFIICMMIAILLTGELRVKYFISEISSNRRSFHLAEGTTDDILTVMDELAKKHGVTAYIFMEQSKKQGDTDYIFYQTSDFDKNFRYTYRDRCKSVLYGNINIKRVPLTSFSGIKESTYFTIKGDKKNLNSFFDELEKHADLIGVNSFNSTYGDDMITTYLVIWAVIAMFMFFVSMYQVSLSRREKMIAICNGNSPAAIILKEMISDLLFEVPATALMLFGMKAITSIKTDKQLFFLISVIIFVSVIPCFSYAKFSIRAISHENKMLAKIVGMSRVFKVIITAMLIGVAVTSAASIEALARSYKSDLAFEKYLDHDIVTISANDLSGVPEEYFEVDTIIAQMYADEKILKEIYPRFYEKCDITIIDQDEHNDDFGGFSLMYCNGNAAEYVSSKFPRYIADPQPADVYFFVPQNEPESERRIAAMNADLRSFNIRSDLEISVILYDHAELNYFDRSEDPLIGTAEDPYLIFDTTIPTADSLSSDWVRLETADLTLKMTDELTAFLDELNAKTEFYNLRESIEYQIRKTRNEMVSLIVVTVMLLVLEIVMTYNIFAFDYRRNMKEYCVKRALGCSAFSKYRGQFLYMILIYLISISGVCASFRSAGTALVAGIGSALMLTDLAAMIIFIIRTENKKVIAVLKGGML